MSRAWLACGLAAALAGCNSRQAELSANVAGGEAAAQQQPAQVAAEPAPIAPIANGVPLPPVRPDFEKIAQAARESAAKVAAYAPATPAPAQDNPPEAQTPPRPAGIFGIFAGAPAEPQAQEASAAQPASPAVERVSIIAYERRMTGEPEQAQKTAVAPSPPPAGPASPRLTPGAVVEVGGVTRVLPANATPVLIAPAPRIAASFGAAGGTGWRPAYDHVQTSCFPTELRRALNVIGQHFNSEVLVTSGYRGNGRRRSMHRSCRAADIRVAGVSPGAVARFASTVPGINGVGTYRRVSVTHVDIRENRMAWRH